MSYDPYRTNMLPDMGAPFPITEELPAVGGGGGGPTGRFLLKVLAVLLVAAIAAIAAILVIDNQRSDQVTTGGDTEPTPTAAADDPTQTPAPTVVVEFERGDPGYWRVVDVAEGLNVRSGPGTTNDVIGVLTADSRHVLGTGQTASVDGSRWTEVRFDAADRVGWVSARFLEADTPPGEDEPTPEPTEAPSGSVSVVCFRNDGDPLLLARLEFTNRTQITGLVRTTGDGVTAEQTVEGTLDNGRADMTLTDLATNARARQTWTFNPANVEFGNGRTLDVVDCAAIAGELG